MTSISGPINVIRLTGSIFDINKVIYLCMDEHKDIKHQTKCRNVDSDNIIEYVIKVFNKHPDTIYDLFVEMYPTDIITTYDRKEQEEIYLNQVRDFFKRQFKYDTESNKVTESEIPNLRLHYIDIRDYLKYFTINTVLDIMNSDIKLNNIPRLTNTIKFLIDQFKSMRDIIFAQSGGSVIQDLRKLYGNDQKSRDKAIVFYINVLINKIFNKYHHTEI